MVGSFVARRAVESGYRVRALFARNRPRAAGRLDIEYFDGDLSRSECFPACLSGVDVVVHAAAHIGDWGPADKYRAINVVALEHLLAAANARETSPLDSSQTLGVYPARHHYGTDETVPADMAGLDGYTRTKAEAEVLLRRHIMNISFQPSSSAPGSFTAPANDTRYRG